MHRLPRNDQAGEVRRGELARRPPALCITSWNKYILAYSGFPYPITLTMWHMFFCSILAIALVKSGHVASSNMERETYLKCGGSPRGSARASCRVREGCDPH